MEAVSVSTKRRTEKVCSPDDDPSSREVVAILMSLDLVLMNFKVAEVFCKNRFGDAAVDRGLECGLGVDCATCWDIEDERRVKEVK